MIRFSMLKILLGREFHRLRKNPSAIMLLGMLTAVALLMATSRPVKKPGPLAAYQFWVVYDRETELILHLETHRSDDLRVKFLPRERMRHGERTGEPMFPPGDCGIELKHVAEGDVVKVQVIGHYFGSSPDILSPFWNWFWPSVVQFQDENVKFEPSTKVIGGRAAKSLEETSISDMLKPELMGTVLLLIAQFFTCCHLLVSFTAQDRERGTLTALVLSPARISEILVARFIFHLILSLVGCCAIVAILQPAALFQPVLWIVILASSIGFMSVGTCIATLARTQASAAMLALIYMLVGAVLFYLSEQLSGFKPVRRAVFENYSFELLYLTLRKPQSILQVNGLGTMLAIVAIWVTVARTTFYRYGWR